MKPKYLVSKNDVVQLAESHKWCGCICIVEKVLPDGSLMLYLPVPESGTIYLRCGIGDIVRIGEAVFVNDDEDGD